MIEYIRTSTVAVTDEELCKWTEPKPPVTATEIMIKMYGMEKFLDAVGTYIDGTKTTIPKEYL